MSIEINTTHTITCENAPVEEVYREMQDKCPGVMRAQTSTVRMLIEDKDRLTRERDDATSRAQHLVVENKRLSSDNEFAMRRIGELQDTVADRNRERDEWAKSSDFFENKFNTKHDELVHSCNETKQERALKEALVSKVAALTSQRNAAIREIDILTRERNELQRKLEGAEVLNDRLKDIARPALPGGMRIAEHPKYGRVVVSPETFSEGCYKVFINDENSLSKAGYGYAKPSELTFLDKEPEPAPLPKPEDCKPGELYLARALGREVVATRSGQLGSRYPWLIFYPVGHPCVAGRIDEQITLLARLLPDREIKVQA